MTSERLKPSSRWGVPNVLLTGALGYARSCAKNVVKLALGRRPHFTPLDVLFRTYLRQVCGGPKLQRITCVSLPGEGAGSQALAMMKAIHFARRFGLTYVHTPFAEIHHADRPMQEWAAAWEALFNLGLGEARSDSGGVVNYVLTVLALHALFDDEPESPFDAAIIREFRRRYYADKSPRMNTPLSLCIHVRRMNRGDSHGDDASDLLQLARTLAQVRSVLEARGVDHELRVFSQGGPDEFGDLGVAQTALFLDVDAVWTMRELIEADILVTTKGSFSEVAGILCDGIILGDASVAPANGWIAYDAKGDFDREALAGRLPRHRHDG